MAINATEQQNIVKLVVAMFDAAPGSVYLDEIVQLYEANGHNLSALAVSLSQTSAFHSIYNSGLTSQQFAAKFLTTLGLEANQTAIDFVVAKANAGVNRGQIILEAATALNASTSSEFAAAKALLLNKTDVALYYSIDLNVAETDLDDLQGALDGVTSDPASVAAVKAELAAVPAQVFVLTTGPNLFTGGTGNDTFHGFVNVNASGGQTLSSSDILQGGGGIDTLSVVVEDNSDTELNLNMTGIEVLKVRALDGQSFNLGAVTGLTSVVSEGSDSYIEFYNVQNLVDASIVDNTGGDFWLSYDLDDFAATATQKVTVETASSDDGFRTFRAFDNDGYFETYDVVSAGTTDNTLFVVAGEDTETINVSGTADIELLSYGWWVNNNNDNLTTVDASTLAAGLTFTTEGTEKAMTINGGSGNDAIELSSGYGGLYNLDHQIDLGAGNDQLTGNANNRVGSGAVIDGGAGKDSVAVALIDVGNATAFKNFEILDVANIGTEIAFDAAVVSGSTFTGVVVSGDLGYDFVNNDPYLAALVIGTGFSDGLTVTGDPDGDDLTLGFAGVAGTADALNITFNDANDGSDSYLDFGTLKVNGIETFNIVSSGTDSHDANSVDILSSNTVTTINVTGANDFGLGGIANLTAARLNTFTKLDASTATGNNSFTISDLVLQQYNPDPDNDPNTAPPAGAQLANVAYTVLLGSGDDAIRVISGDQNTKTTTANITVTAGGDDVVDVEAFHAAGANVGTGAIGSIVNVTGANAGDEIYLGSVAHAAATLGSAENISGATNQAQAAQFAIIAAGTDNVAWFTLGGNTFIVVDRDDSNTFSTFDTVVKLVGTVDLSGADWDGSTITI